MREGVLPPKPVLLTCSLVPNDSYEIIADAMLSIYITPTSQVSADFQADSSNFLKRLQQLCRCLGGVRSSTFPGNPLGSQYVIAAARLKAGGTLAQGSIRSRHSADVDIFRNSRIFDLKKEAFLMLFGERE